MMEQLKESDASEDEIAEVDREMINRLNATEDGKLVGRIIEVKLLEGNYSTRINIIAKTPVGQKSTRFSMPETPTDDDDIVRLCKANGVDPKYPSMLEGCEVKWDDDELVIPKSLSQRISGAVAEKLHSGDWKIPKLMFWYTFLPITLTTYYFVVSERDRTMMRTSLLDYMMHIFLWMSGAIAVLSIFLIPMLV